MLLKILIRYKDAFSVTFKLILVKVQNSQPISLTSTSSTSQHTAQIKSSTLPPWVYGSSLWQFLCVICSMSWSKAQTTPNHILFPDNRPGLPWCTNTAGIHHSVADRKLLQLTHCVLTYTATGSSLSQPAFTCCCWHILFQQRRTSIRQEIICTILRT